MDLREQILRRGIAEDVQYVGRMMRDLNDPASESFSGLVAFCIAPYISLFAHESYRKLQMLDPTLVPQLSPVIESVIARSRHSLKLFDDTSRGIDGQLEYFRDKILSAHRSRFLGNTWLRLARPLESDLGLFFYDGRLITTTHSATFHLGIDPGVLLKSSGPQIRSFYEEYGTYFAKLGARLDTPGRTFIHSLDPKKVNPTKDVRTESYYQRIFEGEANLDLNALLTVFRGMLNFVNTAMPKSGASSVEYSPWKIRYLTLYQVLSSLNALHREQPSRLGSRSMGYVGQIIDSTEAQFILDESGKPFRNTFMHYDLDSRVDKRKVDPVAPLFGLVPIYFPGYDIMSFSNAVDRCITETAAMLEEWGR